VNSTLRETTARALGVRSVCSHSRSNRVRLKGALTSLASFSIVIAVVEA
jgi:hypothetical protein